MRRESFFKMATHPNLHFHISSVAGFPHKLKTPSSFEINFQNNPNNTGTLAAVPHQMSLLNLTPNIYGPGCVLYLLESTGIGGIDKAVIEVKLPPGSYNYLTFAEVLTNEIESQTSNTNVIINIDPVTFLLEISADLALGVFSFAILSLNGVSAYLTAKQANISANLWMGVSLTENHIFSNIPTVLPNFINLAGPSQVNVTSSRLSFNNSIQEQGIAHNYLGSIDLSRTSFGSWARTETKHHKTLSVHYSDGRKFDSVDIQLTDFWGNIIPFPPQAIFSMDLVSHKYSS